DTQQVALAVSKPGGSFANTTAARVSPLDLGDAVDRLDAGQVVFFEDDSPRPQLAHRGLDVVHFPSHLSMLTGRTPSRLEQAEPSFAASVAKTTRPLLNWHEAKLLFIKSPCSLQILSGKPGGNVSVFKHGSAPFL